jgi:hypothetical protein
MQFTMATTICNAERRGLRSLIIIVSFAVGLAGSAVAATVNFDIDAAHSSLTASSQLLNGTVTVVEQKSGSLTSTLNGSIQGDLTNSVFTFNATSNIDPPLHPQAPFQPSGSGWSGEDNYGGQFHVLFLGDGTMAGRDFVLTISSGNATVNGSVTGLQFRFNSGHLDIDTTIVAAPCGGRCTGVINMADSARNTANDASSSPLLLQTVGNTQTLTIPVDITNQFTVVNPNDSTFTLRGTITATRSLSLDGDFNQDGAVNAADYVLWRKQNRSLSDFNLWRANFGKTQAAGLSASTAPVPEPTAFIIQLATCGGAIALCLRSRRLKPCRCNARFSHAASALP